ncbi:MAG: hypothetical protein E6R13_09750 [Spirochaetes bacterium]|nr:MAG: hypothetical protein E6R13_09750 [Spirochaetota bacterium]
MNPTYPGKEEACGNTTQPECLPENRRTVISIDNSTAPIVYYDETSELGCANGISYQRVSVYTETGVFSRFDYINSSGVISSTMPTGFVLGPCAPVPFDVTIQNGCLDTDTVQASTQATSTIQALIPAENIVNVRIVECGSKLDPEVVCLVPNGSPVGTQPVTGIAVFDTSVLPPITTYYIGNTDVTATHTQVACDANQDFEIKETCYQLVTDVNYKYTRIDWFEKSNFGLPIATIWFDTVLGTYSAIAPVGIQICQDIQTVDISECDGTTTPVQVNSLTATYLLNQKHKHTEVVYDVLTATFGGTATFSYTAPFNVKVSYAGVTLANDTMLQCWTDFGDGYNDVGQVPEHAYNSDGAYEIKGYAVTVSGNKILLFAKEVSILNGVITYSGVVGSQAVSRTYVRLVASAFQDYCDGILVGTAYNPDKTPYTLVGDFIASAPIIIDELEDNADYTSIISAPAPSTLLSGGVSIANGTFSTNLGPDGTIWNNPGGLRSITIRARRSNNGNAIVGSGANQVVVTSTDNAYVLLAGESVTYSVEDSNIQDLISVETLNNAAALIIYNRI